MAQPKRTYMKPEARRAQLLDCGAALFFSKGFEGTTMADILNSAGVSKGGFYHHFESKDALLYGVFDRVARQILTELEQMAQDSSRPVLDRLKAFLGSRGDFLKHSNFPAQVEVFANMKRPQNIAFQGRFDQLVRDLTVPILSGLIAEGVADGTLKVDDVAAAAEMLMHVLKAIDPAFMRAIDARATPQADAAAAHLRAVMALQYAVLDHVLGLPKGTTDFGWPGIVDAIMAVPVLSQTNPMVG